nr:CAP domain-containing protein [uncultured Methanoregula sp.]
MAQRFCGKCGSPRRSPDQKFCGVCGAPFPPDVAPVERPPATQLPHGVSRWLLVIAVIAVIAVVCLAAISLMAKTSPAATSSGPAGNLSGITPDSSAGMPLTGASPLPSTAVTAGTLTTAPVTQVTISTSPPATVFTTVVTTPAPVRTTGVATTIPTEVPVTSPTSQITMSVTKIPVQPPQSSYTSQTPGAPYLDPASLEVRIHDLINIQRQQNGLLPLAYDSFLADIARGHSWDMVSRNFFDHINPEGKNPRARGDDAGYPCIRTYKSFTTMGIAENLFQGNRYSAYYTDTNNANGTVTAYDWNSAETVAQTVVNGWMNSEGHRKNILTDTYYQEGIGVAFSSDDKIYITENFC